MYPKYCIVLLQKKKITQKKLTAVKALGNGRKSRR